MRRVIMEEFDTDAAVAVMQEGDDEIWLINSLYSNNLARVVEACNKILEEADEPCRFSFGHRTLQWLRRPFRTYR